MREYNIIMPVGGLKQKDTDTKGYLELRNLRVGDGYWNVPKAYTVQWDASGQLLKGKSVTLLWREGEEEEPEELPEGAIEITSVAQMELLGTTEYPLDGYYYLSGNIDASDTETWHDGEGYDPPCQTPATRFQGTFDGRGYTISGLFINRPTEQGVGLFGTIGSEATVKNLTMANVNITGFDNVGGLSGGCSGHAENCHSSGTVNGSFTVGGLIGNNASVISVIEKCSSSCDVTLVFDTSECYYGGGLVGNSIGTIRNCYASGAITKTQYSVHDVGGLVGYLGANGVVENCYSVGSVVVDPEELELIGGLIGASDGTVTASYYDSETSGYDDTGKGEPKTTAEMQLQATFVDWDFTTIWQIADNYPYHRQAFDTTHDALYSVNESTFALTGLYNVARVGRWQMADYGPYIILSDGTTTLLYEDGIVTPTTVRIGALCGRDARLVYGDLDNHTNCVFWSAVNGEDIPGILAGTTVRDRIDNGESITDILADAPLLGREAIMNEAGSMVMPWRGKILSILPIGEGYVVYGEDGISGLQEAQGRLMPVDLDIPKGLGLWSRSAVDGDINQHLFRGSDGGLWAISANWKVVRLDYVWAFDDHNEVVYDALDNQFWISNTEEAFLFTQYGLSGPIWQPITSLITIGNDQVATGADYPEEIDVFMHSNTIDLATNAQKRINVVNINGSFSAGNVGMLYKYSNSDDYRERTPVPCSPEGASFLNTSFCYGEIKFSAIAENCDKITRIEVRFQIHDRRFIRGTRGFADSPEESGR